MPVERKSRNREIIAVCVTTAVMLGVYALVQSTPVQDWWKGLTYDEPAAVKAVRENLGLTGKGERIFLATRPEIEKAEDFNNNCESHHQDVALLGCYVNDKMHIYEVQREDLKDSNKVTAAHELLHAVWARMGDGERAEVEQQLRVVQRQYRDWVETELDLYKEEEKMEELYTRVGTKLREIPEELEAHYQEYFTNRLKIVDFYENYQAPFNELKERNRQLKEKIDKLNEELLAGKDEYDRQVQALNERIAEFNRCAAEKGCIKSDQDFAVRRGNIQAGYLQLEKMRGELNAKIDENNALILEYNQTQRDLGELSDALNSNVNKIEGEKYE